MTFDDDAFIIDGQGSSDGQGKCASDRAADNAADGSAPRVRALLLDLGVKRGSGSFGILEDTVLCALKGGEVYGRLTNEIYPAVAVKRRRSEASVEKACRDSLKRCWQHGNREMLVDILGGHSRILRGSPTVCEFLYAVRDRLDEAS